MCAGVLFVFIVSCVGVKYSVTRGLECAVFSGGCEPVYTALLKPYTLYVTRERSVSVNEVGI